MATLTEGCLVFVLGGHLKFEITASLKGLLGRVAHVEVLDLRQVELLGAEDGARSSDTNPANKSFSSDLVVFHSVYANQGARAAKTCLAVDGKIGRASCRERV